MARYDRGVKFDYPSQNDGFLSHVARRGAEKTATGVTWFLLIFVALMILGGIESGSPFFITIAVIGGLALLGKVLPDPKKKLSSQPSATPAARTETPWTVQVKTTDGQTRSIAQRFTSRDAALQAAANLRTLTSKEASPRAIVAYRPLWDGLGGAPSNEPTDFIVPIERAETPWMVEIKMTDGQTNWVSKRFANREAALAAGADARRRFASREEALQAGANLRTLTLEDGAKMVLAYRPVWDGLGEAPPNEPTDFIPRAQTPWTIEAKTADGATHIRSRSGSPLAMPPSRPAQNCASSRARMIRSS